MGGKQGMRNNIFEITQAHQGYVEMRSDACPSGLPQATNKNSGLVVAAWRSPHASLRANQLLEKDLKRAYQKYYIITLIESFGLFWN